MKKDAARRGDVVEGNRKEGEGSGEGRRLQEEKEIW